MSLPLKTVQKASEHFKGKLKGVFRGIDFITWFYFRGIDLKISEYTEPCWLLLYPEGTRYTLDKHKASVEFAREKQIEPMKHHLIPRAKGFHEITSRNFVYFVSDYYDS